MIITAFYCVYTLLTLHFCGRSGPAGTHANTVLRDRKPRAQVVQLGGLGQWTDRKPLLAWTHAGVKGHHGGGIVLVVLVVAHLFNINEHYYRDVCSECVH